MTIEAERLREEVRARYAEAATAVATGQRGSCGSGSCCAEPSADSIFGEGLYGIEQRGVWAFYSLNREALAQLASLVELTEVPA